MPEKVPTGRRRRAAGFAAVLVAGLIAPTLVAANGAAFLQGTTALSPFPKTVVNEPARIHVAQSQTEAQLNLRVQQLEEQVRNLTGQVEGLQFQLTQMQTLVERMNEDNNFRFQALEGGAGKKPEAAAQPGGVTPSEVLPQNPATAVVPPLAPPADNSAQATPPAETGPAVVEGSDVPMDDLGNSSDPLLGVGIGEESPLGTLPANAVPSGPLDLSLENAGEPNADAEAQYQAGYDAVMRSDYAFAEEQFRQYMALYPKEKQAPDAANWLGEALIQRGAYDEAADVLLTGFQNYPNSTAAPDLLLKLAIALNGAGEQETACRTFDEVSKRFATQPASFVTRLGEERAKAKCAA